MGDVRDRIQKTLDDLSSREGILGSALVSRDGIPVGSAFGPDLEEKPFSILVEGAMTAAVMGAAEAAMEEVSAGETRRVVVETDELKMVLVGAKEDLLLVTLTEPDRALPEVLTAVRETVDRVAKIMSGD